MLIKVFFSVFISGNHFVDGRTAILSILVERRPRNISVKVVIITNLGQRQKKA